MPAVSQQQQKIFGLALSVKRGETPRSEASQEVLDIVDSMTEKEIEDFAGTDLSGLPTKVEQKIREKVREILKNNINEVTEPQIITQLRDVLKTGYKSVKDPKTGKSMKVDKYSASAIVGVYDKLNQSNKDKFAQQGLLKMQSIAFKLLKNESVVNEAEQPRVVTKAEWDRTHKDFKGMVNGKPYMVYLDKKKQAPVYGPVTIKESAVNEAPSDAPHYKKVGNEYFVDTRFVQLSNQFGTLRHMWMGNFILDTPNGEVNMFRDSKSFPNFVGRTHLVSGDKKAVDTLMASMIKKHGIKSESINESNDKIVSDIIALSSGTMAKLTGKKDYKSIDKIQGEFANWVSNNSKSYSSWMKAWDDYSKVM